MGKVRWPKGRRGWGRCCGGRGRPQSGGFAGPAGQGRAPEAGGCAGAALMRRAKRNGPPRQAAQQRRRAAREGRRRGACTASRGAKSRQGRTRSPCMGIGRAPAAVAWQASAPDQALDEACRRRRPKVPEAREQPLGPGALRTEERQAGPPGSGSTAGRADGARFAADANPRAATGPQRA
jgi:hypothetical protein